MVTYNFQKNQLFGDHRWTPAIGKVIKSYFSIRPIQEEFGIQNVTCRSNLVICTVYLVLAQNDTIK